MYSPQNGQAICTVHRVDKLYAQSIEWTHSMHSPQRGQAICTVHRADKLYAHNSLSALCTVHRRLRSPRGCNHPAQAVWIDDVARVGRCVSQPVCVRSKFNVALRPQRRVCRGGAATSTFTQLLSRLSKADQDLCKIYTDTVSECVCV